MGGIEELTITKLKENIFMKDGLVILLFCTNKWKSCNELEQILKEIGIQEKQKIHIYKADYNKHKDLFSKFEVISLPTLIFFKNGQEIMRQSGTLKKNRIEIMISTVI